MYLRKPLLLLIVLNLMFVCCAKTVAPVTAHVLFLCCIISYVVTVLEQTTDGATANKSIHDIPQHKGALLNITLAYI